MEIDSINYTSTQGWSAAFLAISLPTLQFEPKDLRLYETGTDCSQFVQPSYGFCALHNQAITLTAIYERDVN